MNGYLLDTDVLSMLSPGRTEASPLFLDWLERMDADGRAFLSVITVHEIEKGIALLEHKGATTKAAGLVASYDDKIIGLDTSSAALAGQLEAKAISAGPGPGMSDAILAGIAKTHDLRIISRNTRHFVSLGGPVSSPDETAR